MGQQLAMELSLGKNVLVAFMTWDGYNFEDAMVISESLLKDDRFTSYTETSLRLKLGKLNWAEKNLRAISQMFRESLKNLDENGVIRNGTKVKLRYISR